MTGSSSSPTISKKIKEKKYYTITIHISIMYSSTSLPRTIFTYTISNLTCHITIYPFHATGLFLYPVNISENLSFSDVFKGYRKRQGV